ncbi:MAG: F0F1 ATP synthase subunit B [Elusimicrobia bacterium]|nr:F0F1 ATP synthase subunit B [Elusimicrobiota bacterium]
MDVGLMVWTVLVFVILLAIMGKFGWGPMIAAIEDRERRLREERKAAEAARAEAQRIQADLEARLAEIDAKSREAMAQAAKDAEAFRSRHAAQAHDESKRILEKARAELEMEKQRLVRELRQEVATLSVMAAEKIVRKSVDDGVQKSVLDSFFKELEQKRAN